MDAVLNWVGYTLVGCLVVGVPILSVVTASRESAGRRVPIATAHLLPLTVILFFLSPLLASVVTPDWSPWTMGGFALALWCSSGFSAIYLWRRRLRPVPVEQRHRAERQKVD